MPADEGTEPVDPLPEELVRTDLEGFPEMSEPDVVRHFTRLSQWNLCAATTLYPLGSCTMKHNPLLCEGLARLPGFSGLHPLVPSSWAQGAMRLCAELARALAEISGMEAVSLQPAAGARRPHRAPVFAAAARRGSLTASGGWGKAQHAPEALPLGLRFAQPPATRLSQRLGLLLRVARAR